MFDRAMQISRRPGYTATMLAVNLLVLVAGIIAGKGIVISLGAALVLYYGYLTWRRIDPCTPPLENPFEDVKLHDFVQSELAGGGPYSESEIKALKSTTAIKVKLAN